MLEIEQHAIEKAEVITTCRRHVLAAMETGNEQRARTIINELREHDFAAANKLRAEIVAAYGTDI